jgi:hypothetical protein
LEGKSKKPKFYSWGSEYFYFHRVAKIKAASKNITLLYDVDTVISELEAIEIHVLNYFQYIFSVYNDCIANDLVARTIPSVVMEDENQLLTRLPLCDEIKTAVFNLKCWSKP